MYWPWKKARPSGAVRRLSELAITSGMRNSFQVHMNSSTTRVRIEGRPTGATMRHRVCQEFNPSSRAASASSRLEVRK